MWGGVVEGGGVGCGVDGTRAGGEAQRGQLFLGKPAVLSGKGGSSWPVARQHTPARLGCLCTCLSPRVGVCVCKGG